MDAATSDTTSGLDVLSSLVPRNILSDYHQMGHRILGAAPLSTGFSAAVLLVDLVGFTTMTERFERRGPEGVELLTDALDQYFGAMVSEVSACGGTIIDLLGDALVAVWPLDHGGQDPDTLMQVLSCAAALNRRLADARLQDGTQLVAHSTIVAGDLEQLYIGGQEGRRFALLSGAPLRAMEPMLKSGEPRDVIIDNRVEALLRDRIQVQRLDGTMSRVADLDTLPVPTHHEKVKPPDATDAAKAAIAEAFLAKTLRHRIQAGDPSWLAEFRNLTICFLRLDSLSLAQETDPEVMHAISSILQNGVRAYGGEIQSFVHGDKGLQCFSAFGLPMLAQKDDAYRAVRAMQQVKEQLAARGHACSIGICTGPTFCGLLGHDAWRTYSVRGTVTNRAAWLMMASNSRLLIDDSTRRLVADAVALSTPETITYKGTQGALEVWTVLQKREVARPLAAQAAVVGRDAELAQIDQLLSRDASDPTAPGLLIEGVPGVGKSTLLDEVARRAEAQGLNVLRGRVEVLQQGAPYAGFSGVLRDLLGILPGDSAQEMSNKATALLNGDETLISKIPLLATPLQAPLADNALTESMDSATRAENTAELLLAIFANASAARHQIIIIDDCQWMDTAAWRLVNALTSDVAGATCLLATRSDMELSTDAIQGWINSGNAAHIALKDLPRDAVEKLIHSVLQVRSVPPGLVDFALERGGGNPFFTRELVLSVREQGLLRIEGDECDLADPRTQLSDAPFPDSIEKITISRVDRLRPDMQFTLKVASVIGRRFGLRALQGVHPQQVDRPVLDEQMSEIRARDFVDQVSAAPDPEHMFQHILMHKAIYGLLPFANRRDLHFAVGSWIETHVEAAKTTQKLALAHHWSMAGQPKLALDYWEKAADEARASGAYPEAARLYERALETLEEFDDIPKEVRSARMHFALGDIFTRFGDRDRAYNSHIEGLRILGIAWPETNAQLGLAVLRAIGRQIWIRLRGQEPDPKKPVLERELVITNGIESFANLFFFMQRLNDLLLTVIMGLNFSELANSLPSARRNYAQFALSLSIAKLHGLSNYYLRKFDKLVNEDAGEFDQAQEFGYAAMQALGRADFAEGRRYVRYGLSKTDWVTARSVLDITSFGRVPAFFEGNYDQALKDLQVYEKAVANASAEEKQHPYFLRIAQGEFYLLTGKYRKAAELLDEAQNLLLPGYSFDRINVLGLRALAEYRLGNDQTAWDIANEALELMGPTAPVGFYAFYAYTGVADYFLDLLETGVAQAFGVPRRELMRRAAQATKALKNFSTSFSLARGQYLIMQSRYLQLQGKNQKALKHAQEALARAREVSMRHDEACALLQCARTPAMAQVESHAHLQKARALFAEMGLSREAEIVADLLARSPDQKRASAP